MSLAPRRGSLDQIPFVRLYVSSDASDPHCSSTFAWAIALLGRDGGETRGGIEHGWVSLDPVLQTRRHSESGYCTSGEDIRVVPCSIWCILPTNKGQQDMLHGIDGTEVEHVRVIEFQATRTQTKEKRSENRRKTGRRVA